MIGMSSLITHITAVYEGEWENDMHNGHGSFTEYATGDVYEGNIFISCMHALQFTSVYLSIYQSVYQFIIFFHV
jgi:hypothetical protein